MFNCIIIRKNISFFQGYEGYADPYARDPYAESGYGAG